MRWWKPEPDATPLLAWYDPLVAVSRRARQREVPWPIFVDEFEFFGRVERGRRPAISIYGHALTGGQLLADSDGRTYSFRAIASGRSPGRFTEIPLSAAIYACDLPAVAPFVLEPLPPLGSEANAHPSRGARRPHVSAPTSNTGGCHLRLVRGGAA
jgi:hypothetical protein